MNIKLLTLVPQTYKMPKSSFKILGSGKKTLPISWMEKKQYDTVYGKTKWMLEGTWITSRISLLEKMLERGLITNGDYTTTLEKLKTKNNYWYRIMKDTEEWELSYMEEHTLSKHTKNIKKIREKGHVVYIIKDSKLDTYKTTKTERGLNIQLVSPIASGSGIYGGNKTVRQFLNCKRIKVSDITIANKILETSGIKAEIIIEDEEYFIQLSSMVPWTHKISIILASIFRRNSWKLFEGEVNKFSAYPTEWDGYICKVWLHYNQGKNQPRFEEEDDIDSDDLCEKFKKALKNKDQKEYLD